MPGAPAAPIPGSVLVLSHSLYSHVRPHPALTRSTWLSLSCLQTRSVQARKSLACMRHAGSSTQPSKGHPKAIQRPSWWIELGISVMSIRTSTHCDALHSAARLSCYLPLTPQDTAWNTGHHAVTNAWATMSISLHLLQSYEFALALENIQRAKAEQTVFRFF